MKPAATILLTILLLLLAGQAAHGGPRGPRGPYTKHAKVIYSVEQLQQHPKHRPPSYGSPEIISRYKQYFKQFATFMLATTGAVAYNLHQYLNTAQLKLVGDYERLAKKSAAEKAWRASPEGKKYKAEQNRKWREQRDDPSKAADPAAAWLRIDDRYNSHMLNCFLRGKEPAPYEHWVKAMVEQDEVTGMPVYKRCAYTEEQTTGGVDAVCPVEGYTGLIVPCLTSANNMKGLRSLLQFFDFCILITSDPVRLVKGLLAEAKSSRRNILAKTPLCLSQNLVAALKPGNVVESLHTVLNFVKVVHNHDVSKEVRDGLVAAYTDLESLVDNILSGKIPVSKQAKERAAARDVVDEDLMESLFDDEGNFVVDASSQTAEATTSHQPAKCQDDAGTSSPAPVDAAASGQPPAKRQATATKAGKPTQAQAPGNQTTITRFFASSSHAPAAPKTASDRQ